jgi:O-antigen/teichoic acid export membrane protein
VTFYFGYLSAFLQGRGDISQANQMTVLSKSTFTVLAAVGLIAGGGLISVGIASLLSAIIGRLIGLKYFNAHPVSARAAKMTIDLKRNAEAKVLWYNASRLGLVQIGAFLIQRGSTLVASSLLGLTVAGSYGLSNTIVIVLAGVSAVIFQLQVPSFSSLNASGNIESVRKIYAKSLVLSTILFWLGAGVLIFSGEYFLRIIDSKTQLVSVDALLFLVLISFLEMNHSMAATYLTTLNEIPFVKSSLISGIGVLIMSLALTPICGIWGILLSQGIVQMAYNNWKWPSAVSAKLKMTYASLFISGIRLIITKHG